MPKRTLDAEHADTVEAEAEAAEAAEAAPQPIAGEASTVLALQRGAGNAAVSRLLANRGSGAKLARWQNLGKESWHIRGLGGRNVTVWTGTKAEWSKVMGDIDDQDEYNEHIQGFLEVSNDPSLVGRKAPPRHISRDPASVNFVNTITRAPNTAEKLAFLEALYEKAGGLDLWHGGALEGGPWVHYADEELSKFLRANQGLYIAARAASGQRMDTAGLTALAEQGGRKATLAMITNAGATAHKGVDVVMSANAKQGREREVARSQAYQLIRNSAQTMRAALAAHDARVAFERAVIGFVFDQVWDTIPGGGQLVSAGKALLKAGLEKGLEKATEESGPSTQVETINDEFVKTCNGLVSDGHITSDDAQHAINGFEAGVR